MSLKDAIQDGIPYRPAPGGWGLVYSVQCVVCGFSFDVHQYSSRKVYACRSCQRAAKERARIAELTKHPEVFTERDLRFINAASEIEAQVDNFDTYRGAIATARKASARYGSIPEAMVAIELIRLGYRIVPQQVVSGYRVDFALPNEKLVIEVDGHLYHGRKFRPGDREARVQFALGLDWKIIHISAELIRKDIQKLQAYIERAEDIYS